MDSASLFMFALLPILAILFSVISLMQIHVRDLYDFIIGFFSSFVSMLCWALFAQIWPVVATEAMYVPIAYLWMGFSGLFFAFIFVYIALYIAVATDPKRKQEATLTLH